MNLLIGIYFLLTFTSTPDVYICYVEVYHSTIVNEVVGIKSVNLYIVEIIQKNKHIDGKNDNCPDPIVHIKANVWITDYG